MEIRFLGVVVDNLGYHNEDNGEGLEEVMDIVFL